VNLPFCDYPEDFEETYKGIRNSSLISDELKDYLENKYQRRKIWVKGYLKNTFCCGVSTSSRIEAKHRTYKKYLDGTKRLCELFKIFKELERAEIHNFFEEVIKSKKGNNAIDKYEDFKQLKEKYSGYCLKILNSNLIQSLNYKIEVKNPRQW